MGEVQRTQCGFIPIGKLCASFEAILKISLLILSVLSLFNVAPSPLFGGSAMGCGIALCLTNWAQGRKRLYHDGLEKSRLFQLITDSIFSLGIIALGGFTMAGVIDPLLASGIILVQAVASSIFYYYC